jgi:hypothetical protein
VWWCLGNELRDPVWYQLGDQPIEEA